MQDVPSYERIDLAASPLQVAAAWPNDRPLVMLHSARGHERWGRWSVLSAPALFERPGQRGGDVLAELQSVLTEQTQSDSHLGQETPPFLGGWIGCFSYELGRAIEPAASCHLRPTGDDQWPLIELAHCPAALVHDNQLNQWYAVGETDRAKSIADALRFVAHCPHWHAGKLTAMIAPDEHLDAVMRTRQYIAAGDIFQANITQQFTAPFSGSSRALAIHALQMSGARYGAYLELPEQRAIISMSPELFLQVESETRTVTTRPIKGTRPQSADPRDLLDSQKDSAELHMIVDLMRNDLGRVCEFGTVQVIEPRVIESHPTVHHGVSTITGRLRPEVQFRDLLAATFPGGSITGAPKIRAMQIIEQLERVQRGPYCGAIGMISAHGNVTLNIAIRTMLMHGQRDGIRWDLLSGKLTYGAGGGIVADSDPMAEYCESLDKAAVLRLVLQRQNTLV